MGCVFVYVRVFVYLIFDKGPTCYLGIVRQLIGIISNNAGVIWGRTLTSLESLSME